MNNNIIIKRAHTNNLCDIDLEIPKHSIVVFSGVSGSGKSSMLFDTIYTEAQRQLIETFGSFARARLPKLSRPDVDEIKNLSTPIVIDQKKMGSNLRSTVGTATELATYIRLLYSRIGQPFLNLPSWCIQKVLTTVSDAEDSAVRGIFRYCKNNLPQVFREQTPHVSCDVIRDALVIGLGYSSCDAGEGIAVSAHGHRLADCILKVVRLKEGDDGLGDRSLTAGVPPVGPVQKLIAALKVIAIS